MSNVQQSWWHRYIPTHTLNPLGLALKLLKSGDPAARSALYMAAAGIALTPLDVALRPIERKEYERAEESREPVILVVGPPRSGTTLVTQYLINSFDVCYLTNLTSLFPRSPIAITKLLGRLVPIGAGDYDAFYGRSRRLSGVNDGLYIWDRWLGNDRRQVPTMLEPGSEESMRQLFAALANYFKAPIINKVNRLNTCAHLVANELTNVQFLCLQRAPLFLAQSLYIARGQILGNMNMAYGAQHPDSVTEDPIEDVCRQVLFYEDHAKKQQQLLGSESFPLISYEEFCENPAALANFLATKQPLLNPRRNREQMPRSFQISNQRKLSEDVFERMRFRLAELGAGNVNCQSF